MSVCLCVCVSVTALAGATNALKAKVRYQQKALNTGKKNVGIELKILGSKVMTVISLLQNLHYTQVQCTLRTGTSSSTHTGVFWLL